jgi:cyanophycinase
VKVGVILLADSQPLFRRDDAEPILASARPILRAAYLGASNGDDPRFYELFAGAMAGIDVTDHRHIRADANDDDRAYLDSADLVLLAGGDVQRGLLAFRQSGLASKVVDAYERGAILVGISAGAIQLGSAGFGLVAFAVDVHAEPEWTELRRLVPLGARGIGIPTGGGVIARPDGSLEPIRRALVEFTVADDGTLREAAIEPFVDAPILGVP